MPYLTEEVAVLEGLLGAYFTSPHLSEGIRRDYVTVHRHMEDGELTRADYQRIRSAVDLLLPLHKSSPSEYKLLVGVLTKTTAMLTTS
ncbi:MAG: hypothetical protein E7425_00665 [Ruminococcaceae bacterium]|nr:hypothetical protein [Oscillospiraceae bacterium]